MTDSISKFSSHVDSIRYDDGTLFVTYQTGKTVAYKNVPPKVFDEVNQAASTGEAIHKLVKGKYGYEYVA